MRGTSWPASAVAACNAALVKAEALRSQATHDAEVEYSEAVMKLRERFESDLAEASLHRRRAILPAHQAYNAAVIAAEFSLSRAFAAEVDPT